MNTEHHPSYNVLQRFLISLNNYIKNIYSSV